LESKLTALLSMVSVRQSVDPIDIVPYYRRSGCQAAASLQPNVESPLAPIPAKTPC
jgi:hypothetical protein